MSNLVLGFGQIGSAIASILDCDAHDPAKNKYAVGHYDVLHVTIPFNDSFIETVKGYQSEFTPFLTIIHSTVQVGTSRKLGAVHSPCRGIHPNLEEGIMTFVKFFGGEQSEEAARIFEEVGILTRCTPKPETTELMKLYDTEQYRDSIVREKEIHARCEQMGVDFNIVYTEANETYNEGYEKLGHPEYKKYVLKHMDGPIGGHCVESNHSILCG
jgi:UDP-N-acetyl-D-mannosaminuronate dehydrogenase